MFRLTSRWSCDGIVAWLLTVVLSLCWVDQAHAQGRRQGDASLRLEYQTIRTGTFHADNFEVNYWNTESHAVLLAGDYALSDRWSVYAVLPYVRKRFIPGFDPGFGTGPGDPHNPNHDYWIDFVPPDKRFHDDGEYHGNFQDLSLGIMYRAIDGPAWTVSPYIGYSLPVSNYPFFAKAAIGARLWNVPVGVDINFVPYFSDWYFRGNFAYVFSEKPLGINVDYTLSLLSAGYWFRANFSVELFVASKYSLNGLRLDYDFSDNPFAYPNGYDTVEWWMHDRLLRHRLLTGGITFNYSFNERYQLSGTYFDTLDSEQTTEVERAYTISLTRYFTKD